MKNCVSRTLLLVEANESSALHQKLAHLFGRFTWKRTSALDKEKSNPIHQKKGLQHSNKPFQHTPLPFQCTSAHSPAVQVSASLPPNPAVVCWWWELDSGNPSCVDGCPTERHGLTEQNITTESVTHSWPSLRGGGEGFKLTDWFSALGGQNESARKSSGP